MDWGTWKWTMTHGGPIYISVTWWWIWPGMKDVPVRAYINPMEKINMKTDVYIHNHGVQ